MNDGIPPIEQWAMACKRATHHVETSHFEIQGDVAIEMAYGLLGLAHRLKGVACEHCGGRGYRIYANTTGWRDGIGVQAPADDVCDKCWGTGRTDRTGPNLRRLVAERAEALHKHAEES